MFWLQAPAASQWWEREGRVFFSGSCGAQILGLLTGKQGLSFLGYLLHLLPETQADPKLPARQSRDLGPLGRSMHLGPFQGPDSRETLSPQPPSHPSSAPSGFLLLFELTAEYSVPPGPPECLNFPGFNANVLEAMKATWHSMRPPILPSGPQAGMRQKFLSTNRSWISQTLKCPNSHRYDCAPPGPSCPIQMSSTPQLPRHSSSLEDQNQLFTCPWLTEYPPSY